MAFVCEAATVKTQPADIFCSKYTVHPTLLQVGGGSDLVQFDTEERFSKDQGKMSSGGQIVGCCLQQGGRKEGITLHEGGDAGTTVKSGWAALH